MILLSFDIEEFDMPFEYGKSIDFKDQISISIKGTIAILDLLAKHNIKATFFLRLPLPYTLPKLSKELMMKVMK